MPPRIPFPDNQVDFWAVSPPDAPYASGRDDTWFTVLGRLKRGVTLAQANADLTRVQSALGREFPKTDRDLRPVIEPMKSVVINGADRSLWLLFASVSLLLLIACTNIATLLLARITERGREIAIRYSLGASRGSIILQLLTESFVLAVMGSAVGLFVAWGATSLFRSLVKALPRGDEINLDWRLMIYALACAAVSTLLFGLIPAWQATRRTIASSLAAGGRTEVTAANPLQWSLVGIQVALAVTLLVGAGLLLGSFRALSAVSPGFDASHVLTLQISAGWEETTNREALMQRIYRDLDAMRNVPGVAFTATSGALPGAAEQYPEELNLIENESRLNKLVADNKFVSPGYFQVMSIPVLQGAVCNRETNWATAVVNRSFAETFSPNRSLLGMHIIWANNPYGAVPAEIRGVVADARENGISHAPEPMVYWCANNPNMSPNYLVRTAGDPSALTSALRQAIHRVEPARSVFDIVPLSEIISAANAINRLRTWLLSLFALIAIALAAIGLYGTLSYFVSRRSREVGLRIALGATPRQILAIFLRQGFGVAVIGCVLGLAMALGSSRLLAGMLFGVSSTDIASYLEVSALVLMVAALASVLPARRAARLDPMQTLRNE
jgi:putative ABC transport system permease protein